MLKLQYDKESDIPKGAEAFYEEKDGKWSLRVEGAKTQADVDKVQASLVKERKDHKDTKDKLAKFGDADPDKVHELEQKVEELEAKVGTAAKDGKTDEAAIERLVEARVKRQVAPLERERDALKKQVGDLTTERDGLNGSITSSTIQNDVRDHAIALKVVGPALDDVLLHASNIFEVVDRKVVTKSDIDGVTAGVTADVWLRDQQEKRSHWWAPSVGGGAHGSREILKGQDNPWSAAGWNLTKQGQLLTAHGRAKADQLAASVGSSVGATEPPPRKAA